MKLLTLELLVALVISFALALSAGRLLSLVTELLSNEPIVGPSPDPPLVHPGQV